MPHRVTTFFDFASPFAYLGVSQIGPLCERYGAEHTWNPVLLGAIFNEIGTPQVPMMAFSPAKLRHAMLDLARYADRWSVPFRWPSRFPMASLRALRLVLAQERAAPQHLERLITRIYRAYWAEDRDISKPEVLTELADELALDGASLVGQLGDPALKQALFDATRAALEAGVFGVPAFFVDGEHLMWGQDRLDLVEWYLAR